MLMRKPAGADISFTPTANSTRPTRSGVVMSLDVEARSMARFGHQRLRLCDVALLHAGVDPERADRRNGIVVRRRAEAAQRGFDQLVAVELTA